MPSAPKRFEDLSKSAQNKAKRQWIETSSSDDGNPTNWEEGSWDIDIYGSQHDSVISCSGASVCEFDDSRPSCVEECINAQADSETDSATDDESLGNQLNVYASDTSDREVATAFDSDDDDPVDVADHDEDPPLYEGAPVTVSEALITILTLSLRHVISRVLLSHILKMVALFCPTNNNCRTSLYKFKKYFSDMRTPLIRHFYCTQCLGQVERQISVCPRCPDRRISYYIEVPIITQLVALFKQPGFYEMLQHRFTRDQPNPDSYRDIYDGDVYKELSENDGFLANHNNISFTFYWDGVSIFKSSKYSIWPVYLIINELPPSERYRRENILLVALWFGDSKPSTNLFLKPLCGSLAELREGIDLEVPGIGDSITVKGIVICITADLPATAMLHNMKQYNGRYGCQKCKQEGVYLLDHRVLVYPYEDFELRDDAETLEHSRQAYEFGGSVCGVKGPTILSDMVYQCVRATAVDMMHCVFEGIVKALLNFWFSPNFSDHPSSLIHSIDLVDKRLCFLAPPSSIQRLPRAIKSHLAYWKAHEMKTWLLLYRRDLVSYSKLLGRSINSVFMFRNLPVKG